MDRRARFKPSILPQTVNYVLNLHPGGGNGPVGLQGQSGQNGQPALPSRNPGFRKGRRPVRIQPQARSRGSKSAGLNLGSGKRSATIQALEERQNQLTIHESSPVSNYRDSPPLITCPPVQLEFEILAFMISSRREAPEVRQVIAQADPGPKVRENPGSGRVTRAGALEERHMEVRSEI